MKKTTSKTMAGGQKEIAAGKTMAVEQKKIPGGSTGNKLETVVESSKEDPPQASEVPAVEKSLTPEEKPEEGSSAISAPTATTDTKSGPTVIEVDDDDDSSNEQEYTTKNQACCSKGCCKTCCASVGKSICSCFKSILGPKAPSFLWCCCCCQNKLPCSFSSIAVKTMNLLLLLIFTILGSFFIIPTSANLPDPDSAAPAFFYTCGTENSSVLGNKGNFSFFPIYDFWGNCRGHAGYFFVYRFYFCLIFYYGLMALITFQIKSTKKNFIRAKIHQGFWIYKMIIIGGLCFAACMGIRIWAHGWVDYVWMWFGLLGDYVFSIIEMVCILDVAELLVIKMKEKFGNQKFKIAYWIITSLIYLLGVSFLCLQGVFNLTRTYSQELFVAKEPPAFYGGSGPVCWSHLGILIYIFFMGLVIALIVGIAKPRLSARRFANLGLLQASLIFLLSIFQMWSAVGNSTDVECRYVFFPYNNYEFNKDVTWTPQGMTHGILAVFAILYITYSNGLRSKAPWTIVYNKIMYLTTGPPMPSRSAPEEKKGKIRRWDDEELNVTYSWPLYYIILILGCFSLMMALTNYFSPWAVSAAQGNNAAFTMKIIANFTWSLLFVLPILKTCSSIFPDSEFPLPTKETPSMMSFPCGYGSSNVPAGLTTAELQLLLQQQQEAIAQLSSRISTTQNSPVSDATATTGATISASSEPPPPSQ